MSLRKKLRAEFDRLKKEVDQCRHLLEVGDAQKCDLHLTQLYHIAAQIEGRVALVALLQQEMLRGFELNAAEIEKILNKVR